MAHKIVLNDTAPSDEALHFSLGQAEFDLGGDADAAYETTDPAVLSDAETHPWLRVEREVVEVEQGQYHEALAPEDDVLSAANSIANDPEEARKAEAAKREAFEGGGTAIESGIDQDESVVEADVAYTLTADEQRRLDEESVDEPVREPDPEFYDAPEEPSLAPVVDDTNNDDEETP